MLKVLEWTLLESVTVSARFDFIVFSSPVEVKS